MRAGARDYLDFSFAGRVARAPKVKTNSGRIVLKARKVIFDSEIRHRAPTSPVLGAKYCRDGCVLFR